MPALRLDCRGAAVGVLEDLCYADARGSLHKAGD